MAAPLMTDKEARKHIVAAEQALLTLCRGLDSLSQAELDELHDPMKQILLTGLKIVAYSGIIEWEGRNNGRLGLPPIPALHRLGLIITQYASEQDPMAARMETMQWSPGDRQGLTCAHPVTKDEAVELLSSTMVELLPLLCAVQSIEEDSLFPGILDLLSLLIRILSYSGYMRWPDGPQRILGLPPLMVISGAIYDAVSYPEGGQPLEVTFSLDDPGLPDVRRFLRRR